MNDGVSYGYQLLLGVVGDRNTRLEQQPDQPTKSLAGGQGIGQRRGDSRKLRLEDSTGGEFGRTGGVKDRLAGLVPTQRRSGIAEEDELISWHAAVRRQSHGHSQVVRRKGVVLDDRHPAPGSAAVNPWLVDQTHRERRPWRPRRLSGEGRIEVLAGEDFHPGAEPVEPRIDRLEHLVHDIVGRVGE